MLERIALDQNLVNWLVQPKSQIDGGKVIGQLTGRINVLRHGFETR